MTLQPGKLFPNMSLMRAEGTGLDLWDLHKKEHALLLFIDKPDAEILALVQRFQDEAKTFEWLHTRMLCVFPTLEKVFSPWPAPMYAPFVYTAALPEGVEWGKGYLISKNRNLYSVYPELPFLSAHKVEQDMLHYEAQHCAS